MVHKNYDDVSETENRDLVTHLICPVIDILELSVLLILFTTLLKLDECVC